MIASEKYLLRLYVTGLTARSTRAIKAVREVCEEHLRGQYELEVIDIYQQPELAREYQVLAVPMLVKSAPAPARCLVGDLSDVETVLRSLDIHLKR